MNQFMLQISKFRQLLYLQSCTSISPFLLNNKLFSATTATTRLKSLAAKLAVGNSAC